MCTCLHIEGPEYGSMKTALKGCLESVDRLADCHIAVKDRLMNVVQARVKEWKNEHYKKSLIGGCREAKSFEDDFRKVCSRDLQDKDSDPMDFCIKTMESYDVNWSTKLYNNSEQLYNSKWFHAIKRKNV